MQWPNIHFQRSYACSDRSYISSGRMHAVTEHTFQRPYACCYRTYIPAAVCMQLPNIHSSGFMHAVTEDSFPFISLRCRLSTSSWRWVYTYLHYNARIHIFNAMTVSKSPMGCPYPYLNYDSRTYIVITMPVSCSLPGQFVGVRSCLLTDTELITASDSVSQHGGFLIEVIVCK